MKKSIATIPSLPSDDYNSLGAGSSIQLVGHSQTPYPTLSAPARHMKTGIGNTCHASFQGEHYKPHNEDNSTIVALHHPSSRMRIGLIGNVADGMGGHAGGQEAAKITSTVVARYSKPLCTPSDFQYVLEQIKQAMRQSPSCGMSCNALYSLYLDPMTRGVTFRGIVAGDCKILILTPSPTGFVIALDTGANQVDDSNPRIAQALHTYKAHLAKADGEYNLDNIKIASWYLKHRNCVSNGIGALLRHINVIPENQVPYTDINPLMSQTPGVPPEPLETPLSAKVYGFGQVPFYTYDNIPEGSFVLAYSDGIADNMDSQTLLAILNHLPEGQQTPSDLLNAVSAYQRQIYSEISTALEQHTMPEAVWAVYKSQNRLLPPKGDNTSLQVTHIHSRMAAPENGDNTADDSTLTATQPITTRGSDDDEDLSELAKLEKKRNRTEI